MRIIETKSYKRLKQAQPNFVQPPGAASTAGPVSEDDQNPAEQEDERAFPIYYYNAHSGQLENGPVCYAGDLMQQVANYAEMMISGDITEFNVTSGGQPEV